MSMPVNVSPPQDVYSVVFSNLTNKKAVVTVTYTDLYNRPHHAEVSVPANGTATAEKKITKKDTATYVMTITEIALVGLSGEIEKDSLRAPFPFVFRPTDIYPVKIIYKNGAMVLVPKESQ